MSTLSMGARRVFADSSKVFNKSAGGAEANLKDTKLIVITDMEPDDRMAIQLLASQVPPSRIVFMGTTVMHAARKKALLCRLNEQIGYGGVPVYQGRGRDPDVGYDAISVDSQSGATKVGVFEIGFVVRGEFKVPEVVKRNRAGRDQKVSSLAAARTYREEGQILGEATRQRVTKLPRALSELTNQIIHYLKSSKDASVTILLLAAPTELEEALTSNPELSKKIERVYLQGGWVSLAPKPLNAKQTPAPVLPRRYSLPPTMEPLCGADTFNKKGDDNVFLKDGHLCLTTYNWNLDIGASAKFMTRTNLPMAFYSSHVVKAVFAGGSINPADRPPGASTQDPKFNLGGRRVWDVLNQADVAKLPSIIDTRKEIKSWDEHVVTVIPTLKPIIESYIDSQFTPADPSLVVGMLLGEDFAPQSTRFSIQVNIDPEIMVPETGYGVTYKVDPASKIQLMTKLNPEIFFTTLADGLKSLPAAIEINKKTGIQQTDTCTDFR
ncbi:MAG: hypothetical protein NTV34_17875 [Proteobacteria bacterium]|nr:hypothetical protein [Pseudomonadota bacterium]